MTSWLECKKILCIRADNMGDLLMTSPALRALKETFNCNITVLTSQMGSIIAPFIPEIDKVIVHDLPWIKTDKPQNANELSSLIENIRQENFDGTIIFTVYSQNPLPAAMLAYMAGIPKRLAYCRENPYQLLSDWAIEKEPLEYVQHQVQRDLQLVKNIGATVNDDHLSVIINNDTFHSASKKLRAINFSVNSEWIIFHPGVSEEKRKYPLKKWVELGKIITKRLNKKILITGSASETPLANAIQNGIGAKSLVATGLLNIQEFIAMINKAPLVITVNTAAVHIAAATQTPVIVLYALTNPQHTPWKVPSKVFPFPVEEELKSNNVIVNYVNKHFFTKKISFPLTENIFYAVVEMLQKDVKHKNEITEIIEL